MSLPFSRDLCRKQYAVRASLGGPKIVHNSNVKGRGEGAHNTEKEHGQRSPNQGVSALGA